MLPPDEDPPVKRRATGFHKANGLNLILKLSFLFGLWFYIRMCAHMDTVTTEPFLVLRTLSVPGEGLQVLLHTRGMLARGTRKSRRKARKSGPSHFLISHRAFFSLNVSFLPGSGSQEE